MDRRQLAELVRSDLDGILARTREAYVERVPRLVSMPPELVEDVLEATRRAMWQFLRYYVEGTLDADAWQAVRDATIERAGEVFTQEEIIEFMAIGRNSATEAMHHLAERHPDLPAEDRERIGEAMDRYVAELAVQEDELRGLTPHGNLDLVLLQLEADGADLA